MSVKEILKMIEEVSPDDTAKLDEIDCLVWSFDNNGETCSYALGHAPRYTRSRDALKGIRPNCFFPEIRKFKHRFPDRFPELSGVACPSAFYILDNRGLYNRVIDSVCLPTEELAELHAVLQAIEYDRNNIDPTPQP